MNSGQKNFNIVLLKLLISIMYVNSIRCKEMQIVIKKFKMLSPKHVFLKTLSVIPGKPVMKNLKKNHRCSQDE